MQSINKQKINYENYDIAEERRRLVEFATSKDLRIPESFLNCLKTGDIIELYSFPVHQQIFANPEFSKMCSYTSQQMSSIPFQKLFWRETEVQDQLIQRAIQVVQNSKTAEAWGLSPHDLVESLHPRRRTFEMHMGFLAPVYDSAAKSVAWASTLRVEYVFEWPAEDIA